MNEPCTQRPQRRKSGRPYVSLRERQRRRCGTNCPSPALPIARILCFRLLAPLVLCCNHPEPAVRKQSRAGRRAGYTPCRFAARRWLRALFKVETRLEGEDVAAGWGLLVCLPHRPSGLPPLRLTAPHVRKTLPHCINADEPMLLELALQDAARGMVYLSRRSIIHRCACGWAGRWANGRSVDRGGRGDCLTQPHNQVLCCRDLKSPNLLLSSDWRTKVGAGRAWLCHSFLAASHPPDTPQLPTGTHRYCPGGSGNPHVPCLLCLQFADFNLSRLVLGDASAASSLGGALNPRWLVGAWVPVGAQCRQRWPSSRLDGTHCFCVSCRRLKCCRARLLRQPATSSREQGGSGWDWC